MITELLDMKYEEVILSTANIGYVQFDSNYFQRS